MSQEQCGPTIHGFTCGLPKGHNMGRVDVPDHHLADSSSTRPSVARPFKDASCAGILADMAVAADTPARQDALLHMVGDKLADAAYEAALDENHDGDLVDAAIDLALLWQYMRKIRG